MLHRVLMGICRCHRYHQAQQQQQHPHQHHQQHPHQHLNHLCSSHSTTTTTTETLSFRFQEALLVSIVVYSEVLGKESEKRCQKIPSSSSLGIAST